MPNKEKYKPKARGSHSATPAAASAATSSRIRVVLSHEQFLLSTKYFDWSFTFSKTDLYNLSSSQSWPPYLLPVLGPDNKITKLGSGAFGNVFLLEQTPCLIPGSDAQVALSYLGLESNMFPVRRIAVKLTSNVNEFSFAREASALRTFSNETMNSEKMFMQWYASVQGQDILEGPENQVDSKILRKNAMLALELMDGEFSIGISNLRSVHDLPDIDSQTSYHKAMIWIGELLGQVSTMHTVGWVHRDLKFGNTLISRGHIKLSDFGFAFPSAHITDHYSMGGTLTILPPTLWVWNLNPKEAQKIVVKMNEELHVSEKFASDAYAVGLLILQIAYPSVYAFLHCLGGYNTLATQDIVLHLQDINGFNTLVPFMASLLQKYGQWNIAWTHDRKHLQYCSYSHGAMIAINKIIWGLLRLASDQDDPVISWCSKPFPYPGIHYPFANTPCNPPYRMTTTQAFQEWAAATRLQKYLFVGNIETL